MSGVTPSPGQVAILIPTYGAADKLAVCLRSLSQHAPPSCPIFVLDDATPDDSIALCCRQYSSSKVAYVRSDKNRGFVTTCNWGWSQVAPPGSDILLLNSDTEVTAGFLEEMHRILYLFERHAVVTPRSNHATIFSVPLNSPDILPGDSFSLWKELCRELPAYRVMPTAVGFCMLVKAAVLERYGLFDEAYSPGYNEENDFVCRINRYGYSAVVANRAFVYHYESSTFGVSRSAFEAEHSKVLIGRFPEYPRKISEYLESELDPVEKFAVLRLKHRPRILFDLFHLPPNYNGTSEFSLSLLREVHAQTADRWDLFVGMGESARFFAAELNGYRHFTYRPNSETIFDIVFKPAQIFTWEELRRMERLAPRLSFVLQDIIAIRCDYLAYPDRKTIFQKTVELADQVFTISHFSHLDFEAYFGFHLPKHTIHHGTNVGLTDQESLSGEHVLVVGNSFAHKGVIETVPYLSGMGPVTVLGGEKPSGGVPDNVEWAPSGQLSRGYVRELYAKARLIIYPSHYEGYGLPTIEGLALGKPVVAMDNELNRELAVSLNNPNFILVTSLPHLKQAVMNLLQNGHSPVQSHTPVRRWSDVAEDYVNSLEQLVERPPDAKKMRARHDFIRVLNAARHY